MVVKRKVLQFYSYTLFQIFHCYFFKKKCQVNTSYHHRRKPEKVLKGVEEESLPFPCCQLTHRFSFVIPYHTIPSVQCGLNSFFNDFISKNLYSHCRLVVNLHCTSKCLEHFCIWRCFFSNLIAYHSIPYH